jgi:adenylate cyclase
LEQAIRIEPEYGLAHAQLARSYHWFFGLGGGQFYPKAKAEAIKALQIDETLAQAHSALGFTIFRLDWDWSGAEKEFKRAIELNPGYSEAHHAYGLYLSAAGRHDEAIREMKRGLELDPLTLPSKVNLGITYLHARQYDQAIEQFRNTLDVNPDNAGLHTSLAVAYVYKGLYEQGIAEFQKVIALSEGDARNQANAAWVYVLSGKAGGDPRKKANLAWAYAMSGKRAEAIKMLIELKESSKQGSVAPISIASIYAALGEKDQALEWLQKVYEDHAYVILYINCYPEFDSLHSDPRFADLVRRVGL